MKLFNKIILPCILSVITLTSCSKPEVNDYSEFSNQGATAAQHFLKRYNSQSELNTIDLLLEIQTSLTGIRQHDGAEAAEAFRCGFEDYIHTHNDTLYALIIKQK